jgi:hypothetical protein
MTDDSSGTDLARRAPAAGGAAGCVTGSEPKRTVSVREPAQLINLVPYQLGFQPADGDIVVLGTAPPSNCVQLTLRWDLPSPDAPGLAAARARHAIAVLAASECTRVAVVGFGPDLLVAPSITVVREAAKAAGLKVWELLRSDGSRYWSYLCTDPACCPPDGVPYSPAGDPVAAAFEATGTRVLASRDVYAAIITPATGTEAASMLAGVVRAARRSARNRARQARGRATGKGSRLRATAEYRAVTAAITAYQAGGSIASHDEFAWLALALTRLPARDHAWTLMDPAHRDAHARLWTELTRLALPGLVAAPATLLALCAWQAGNGPLAQIALDRALNDDPRYPLARLLRDALACAAPPSLADPALILRQMRAAAGDRYPASLTRPPAIPGHPDNPFLRNERSSCHTTPQPASSASTWSGLSSPPTSSSPRARPLVMAWRRS